MSLSVSDFSLGKRQLLGFVFPGSVLVLAVLIGLSSKSPIARVESISIAGWAGIIVVGAVVGHASGHLVFRFTTWSSQLIHRCMPIFFFRDEKAWMAPNSCLRGRVVNAVSAQVADAKVNEWTDEQLFDFCKLMVLERTKAWALKLEERESELNLLAMNVLPSTAFLVAWATKVASIENTWYSWYVGASVVGLLFPLLLLRSIEPLRCREKQVAFEMFLGLPLIPKAEAQGPAGSVR